MEELKKQKNNLHHAYFIIGETSSNQKALENFLENELNFKISGNPDFWRGEFETFTINEARQLTIGDLRKNLSGRKVFVIVANFLTLEAQNALLKVFEEPTKNTHFFILSPQDLLLPTLRSRMQTIVPISKVQKFESILKLNLKKRLEKVKEIVDGISDEQISKQDAIYFLNQIELELYLKGIGNSKQGLVACKLAREYLYDRGAPIKMILENLMLSI